MKKRWKGALIGGIFGFVFSLLLVMYGSNENLFYKPIGLILNLVCSFSTCSDILGFAIFSMIITFIFYGFVGTLIAIVLFEFISTRKWLVLFFGLLLFIAPVQAYFYEYGSDSGGIGLESSVAVQASNIILVDDVNETEEKFSVKYNNQWDNHILDGPWKINKDNDLIPLLVGVIGSDQELNDIYILDANDNDAVVAYTGWAERVRTFPLPWFYLLYVDKDWFTVKDGKIAIKISFDIHWALDNEEGPIYLDYNVDEFSGLNNWYCGDTHYHSEYTHTNFNGVTGELGAPIGATLAVTDLLDLDWLIVTDHSNSFYDHSNDNKSWANFKQDCNSYAECLIGEEVNCRTSASGNWLGNSLPGNHILAYDIDSGFLDNGRDSVPYCSDVIYNVNQQGSFSYAAHPESEMDIIGILDIIDSWQDYSLPFSGLEIWNGDIEESGNLNALNDGLIQWIDLILSGRRVFISAGSDAHGDLNEKFGKEYTCVYVPFYSKENIFSGLKNGNSFISNNGALIFDIGGEMIGGETTITEGDQISLDVDYNLINDCTLRVYRGEIGGSFEGQVGDSVYLSSGSLGNVIETDLPTQDSYYRLECISADGSDRIYTNPIWVNVEPCVSDWDCTRWFPEICPQSEIQTRTCVDLNGCKDSYEEQNNCVHIPEPLPLCTISSPVNGSVYDERRILFDIEASEKLEKIEYIDYSFASPRWRRLCSRCDGYDRERSFLDGAHEVGIKCTPYFGDAEETKLFFFSDSKDPKVSRTEPRRNEFANGNFIVNYHEENVRKVSLFFGNKEVAVDCPSGRNQECYASVDLSAYDGQEIEYYFEIEDVVGRTDDSRIVNVKVDTTFPVLNNPDLFWEQGSGRNNRYIYFDFDVTEKNFAEINYIDWEDRNPRERRLCSRLKDGVCETKKSFRKGNHNLTITILDKAGNFVEEEINFNVA